MEPIISTVIFSGGLDSTVLLYELHKAGHTILPVSFYYGQKHEIELLFAEGICKALNAPHKVLDISAILGYTKSSQTDPTIPVPHGHYAEETMKRTVVPNRNMILLAAAAAYAIERKADNLYYGAHGGDHCIPADSPVWTAQGPCAIGNLEPGDLVMSFNPEARLTEWKPITDVFLKGRPRQVLKITTKSGAQFRCTDEHKVANCDRTGFTKTAGWQKSFGYKKAGCLALGDYLFTPAGALESPFSQEQTLIDLLPLMEGTPNLTFSDEYLRVGTGNYVKRFVDAQAFAELICWYVTEGYPASGNPTRPNNYGVYIAQSSTDNPENLQEILDLARAWGFTPTVHGEGTNTAAYFSGASSKILLECGARSRTKELPSYFLESSNSVLYSLLRTLQKGDGYTIRKEHSSLISTSSNLLRQFGYIGNRLGYKSSWHSTAAKDCSVLNLYKSVQKQKLNRFGGSAISPIVSIEKVANQDPVFDITVEDNHNFFTGDTVPVLVSNSIYPDCRPEFVDAMRTALSLADWHELTLHAPFLRKSKADIVKLGHELKVPFEKTWSCYGGAPSISSPHCGACGTCCERREAFHQAGVDDPTEYKDKEYWKQACKVA